MVEIFKTNVNSNEHAQRLASLLHPMKATFDLDDCDKILRVEDSQIDTDLVVRFVNAQGFVCTLLED